MSRSAARFLVTLALMLAASPAGVGAQVPATEEAYLSWSAERAEAIGRSMYEQGRVGGFFDTRILSTNRSYNYKLAATWLTPDVIRATARLAQLQSRLSNDATRHLVAEAEVVGHTVILVEIDPREGSGVIPLSWNAFLQPKGASADSGLAVPGRIAPEFKGVRALAGTMRRNYDYDRFWVAFPLSLSDGTPLFPPDVLEAEIVVRIYEKEGRVQWSVLDSVRLSESSGHTTNH